MLQGDHVDLKILFNRMVLMIFLWNGIDVFCLFVVLCLVLYCPLQKIQIVSQEQCYPFLLVCAVFSYKIPYKSMAASVRDL